MRQNLTSSDLPTFGGRLLQAGTGVNFISSEKDKTHTELKTSKTQGNLALRVFSNLVSFTTRGEVWLIKANFLNTVLLDFCKAISCVQLGKNKPTKTV